MPIRTRFALALPLLLAAGCSGQAGPQGADGTDGLQGPSGPTGTTGPTGPVSCDGPSGGALETLDARISVSSPASGSSFAPGEQAVLTIQITDRCGRPAAPAALGSVALYLSGPRASTRTKTASKLLNAVTDRNAADRQHHFVDLKAPRWAFPAQQNLVTRPDGALVYTLAPISDEPAGTYTAGVWVRSVDDTAQRLALADLQLGTAAVEAYASGAPAAATCRGCHLGAGADQQLLQHAFASPFAPLGLRSLDEAPVASCQLCHNLDGYSANPTVRKVHGIHRGASQRAPGAAHPEYGLGADTTLRDFTNVTFPSMPGAERDCTACHADAAWTTRPSRLACGTCHDNLYFDTGTLVPPRDFGRPATGACTIDADCAGFSQLATCDTLGGGACKLASHPVMTTDACSGCHSADGSGLSPIPARHQIHGRTLVPGLAISQVVVSGGSGAGGAFLVGDRPVIAFSLADADGTAVADVLTNATYAISAMVSGPVEAPQRVLAASSSKATLVYDAAHGRYAYTFPAWPAQALPPLNADPATPTAAHPAGSYTVYLYVTQSLVAAGQSYRDAASAVVTVPFGDGVTLRPRQVVTSAACNGCHVQLQAHGGSRRPVEGCSTCHTAGALDRPVGSKGLACTASGQCAGFAAGWEACQDTNADGIPDACVITADPTPGATIELGPLLHAVHMARRLGGYAERNDLVAPGTLKRIGFGNALVDFSQALLPQDPRNCATCHADADTACTVDAQCGSGQACRAARCRNVAWLVPSGRACLACHDTAAATGHVALQTWSSPSGPVETCEVCHGPGAAYAPDVVHALGEGVLPLAR